MRLYNSIVDSSACWCRRLATIGQQEPGRKERTMPRNGTIAIAVALLLPLLGSAAEARMMLRVGDSFPPGHPVSENTIKVWMSEVERSVGDEISFQYYPSEQIGKAKDLLSLVAS